MELSDKWVLARSSDKQALYKHPELGNVRLTIENQTRDYGTPMTVAAVKSAVGTELNMAYGGVVTRISLSGNALIHYARDLEEGGKNLHTQNWVVARPHGYGGIARVAITLKVPDQAKADPAVASLIQSLDKQVGDAKLPEA